MIVKLPTIFEEWNEVTKQVEITKGEILVDIDTSFRAHLKWEEQFQAAVGYNLSTYTEMAKEWIKDADIAKAQFVGLLKLLYCYVNSDKLPTFKDFAGLFKPEVAAEILEKITIVLEEVRKTASKN